MGEIRHGSYTPTYDGRYAHRDGTSLEQLCARGNLSVPIRAGVSNLMKKHWPMVLDVG